ncbi:hypothetical protein BFS86_03435 [Shewanella algae]|nr:hypothetical protein BFS86_03435 [Shewanella algae]
MYLEIKFREGMSNPLFFSKVSGNASYPDQVLFGEYWGNSGKESVRVYSRELSDSSPWNILTEFTAGQITHVHNILADINEQRLLILTGDSDKESGVWEIKTNDVAPKKIVAGKQIYRSCIGYVEDNYLYYATDTPQEENFFARLCLTTLEVEKLLSLEGPVIYGSRIKNKLLFSTSVEPDTELSGFRYLLSRRVGRGLKSKDCVVYSYDGINVHEINRFKKDFLPMGLFQFGCVSFYTSENMNYVYGYGMSLSYIDGKTYKFNF